MIPKIIHYTWFSGEEMPQIVKECIATWKHLMPDYEFRLWDMNAIKNVDSVYLKESLSVKKWAYAADYVRLFALYHEGGIYLDTDVMVYKPFNDLLDNKVFIGKEDDLNPLPLECRWGHYLTSHCMGAEPHSEFIFDCLRYFENRHFILSTDEHIPQRLRFNYVILPYVQAVIARDYGYDWTHKNQTIQHCDKDLVVYPSDFFCGFKFLSSTYCQHLVLGSWREGYSTSTDINSFSYIMKQRIKRFISKLFLKCSFTILKLN